VRFSSLILLLPLLLLLLMGYFCPTPRKGLIEKRLDLRTETRRIGTV